MLDGSLGSSALGVTAPIYLARVVEALSLPKFDVGAARQAMAPRPRGWQKRDTPPRAAAVLMLIFPDHAGKLQLTLTLRQSGLGDHSGQVSFPGGAKDAGDADLRATALREAQEEIGIDAASLQVLGTLPNLYIPASHFDVLPVVAHCAATPEFRANPDEVADIFSFALDDLICDRFKHVEARIIRGRRVHAPYYAVAGHKVWGATAMLMSELETRMRCARSQGSATT